MKVIIKHHDTDSTFNYNNYFIVFEKIVVTKMIEEITELIQVLMNESL